MLSIAHVVPSNSAPENFTTIKLLKSVVSLYLINCAFSVFEFGCLYIADE